MSKITVMGFGSWGIALSCLLNENGHNVTAWEFDSRLADEIKTTRKNEKLLQGITIPKSIEITSSVEEAAKDTGVYVFAVPSTFVRSVANQLLPFLNDGDIIINVSKGLEDKTLLRLSEVIEDVAPMCRIGTLSGPSHAEEVANGIPTTVASSSKDEAVAETIQDIFMNPTFRVYTNADLIGVELGGALKNVIALAAGVSDGLGYGDNTKAALMTRGIAEIARLGIAMGAKRETFSGLTGIGDLIVTCTSMYSRNRRAGILLGQGKTLAETLSEVHMVVEGVNTAKAAYDLSVRHNINMPIVTEINRCLFEGKNAKDAVNDLMTRDKTDEHAKETFIPVS